MTLQELINKNHKPELSTKENEMVYQVWDDGEITLQKCGSLLWERTLHLIAPGFEKQENDCLWPKIIDNHGYIFTDEAGAYEVREELEKML